MMTSRETSFDRKGGSQEYALTKIATKEHGLGGSGRGEQEDLLVPTVHVFHHREEPIGRAGGQWNYLLSFGPSPHPFLNQTVWMADFRPSS